MKSVIVVDLATFAPMDDEQTTHCDDDDDGEIYRKRRCMRGYQTRERWIGELEATHRGRGTRRGPMTIDRAELIELD